MSIMNIWRLKPYHERDHYDAVLKWSRINGIVAVGWGGTGDLNQYQIRDEKALTKIVGQTHNVSPTNHSNGGRSLWNLYHEMKIGDIVIVRTSHPVAVMQVTGQYKYVSGGTTPFGNQAFYEHRRSAALLPIDAGIIWRLSGGAAEGQGVFPALIRCENTIDSEELGAIS